MDAVLLDEVFLRSNERILRSLHVVEIIFILLNGLFFYWLNRLIKLLQLKHTLSFVGVHRLAKMVEGILV